MEMINELCKSGLLGQEEAARFVRIGHFTYESGDHGDTWLALELLFGNPRRLRQAAAQLAGRLLWYRADLVCAPLIGGALIGQWIAYELDVSFVFAEPQPAFFGRGRHYVVPREFHQVLSGKRAIIVDDVINAGAATLACMHEIESLGGSVAVLASLIIRQSVGPKMRETLGLPIEALLSVHWNTWPSSDCPLCKSGIELSPAP